MFSSLIIKKQQDSYSTFLTTLSENELPEGNVTIDIEYSSINYKDALAITGRGPIVKKFPMIPGIDFAGTVSKSNCLNFKVGDKVLLTGWGVGEKH